MLKRFTPLLLLFYICSLKGWKAEEAYFIVIKKDVRGMLSNFNEVTTPSKTRSCGGSLAIRPTYYYTQALAYKWHRSSSSRRKTNHFSSSSSPLMVKFLSSHLKHYSRLLRQQQQHHQAKSNGNRCSFGTATTTTTPFVLRTNLSATFAE